jgi:DNA-binding CsgD family transcriptional regulator
METAFALELGGDWARLAAEWARVVLDPRLGPNDPATLMSTHYAALASYCYAEQGERGEASGLLETLTPLLESLTPFDANQNGAVAIAAEAVWRLDLRHLAQRYLGLATALRTRGVGDYPQTSIALTIARMAALANQPDLAREHFDLARTEITASRQRPLRAKVDFDQALFLHRAGIDVDAAEIEQLMASANEAFVQLGMTRWAERAAALRETIANQVPIGADFPGGLSEREVEVLRLVARGLSDRQISDQLFISPRTVNSHIRNMLNKTGAINRTDLSVWWSRQDFNDPGECD